MSGDTLYCGDNCNHTGPHRYPPTAADLRGIVTDPAWAEGHRRGAHTIDLDSPETVERLAAEVAALVSPEMVARSSEPYAQGYINAINNVLARLAPQHPDAETLERLKREAALRPPGQRGYPEVAQHTLDLDSPETVERLARALDSLDGQSAGYWDRRRDPAVLLTNAGLAVAILAALREGGTA